jgi:hypothetical protein
MFTTTIIIIMVWLQNILMRTSKIYWPLSDTPVRGKLKEHLLEGIYKAVTHGA